MRESNANRSARSSPPLPSSSSSSSSSPPPLPPVPRALLLDMDGTLTRPMLDFERIKREMGMPGRPILETLATLGAEQRAAAEAVLLRHEEQAALESTLNQGCDELLGWVRARGLRTALITRNSRLSVRRVLERHGLALNVLIAREDARFKPDPQPLLVACERLGVAPAEAWMVGDGRYDVEAGLAAGVRTVWVSHGTDRPFQAEPWRTVRDLPGLLALLRQCDADSPAAGPGV
ncbi:MAG TPA: HAD family hydrolase [Tepidisphaeraceae bacterium]|nr:HAD family hydrolase [Tepidisphaeraceae bacterium]